MDRNGLVEPAGEENSDQEMSPFAIWFRNMMQLNGWNGLETSERVGVTPSLVSKWRHGSRTPDTLSCRLIAEAFRVPVGAVMVLAGHADPGEPLDDPVKDELINLINLISSRRLEPFLPLFRDLALNPSNG